MVKYLLALFACLPLLLPVGICWCALHIDCCAEAEATACQCHASHGEEPCDGHDGQGHDEPDEHSHQQTPCDACQKLMLFAGERSMPLASDYLAGVAVPESATGSWFAVVPQSKSLWELPKPVPELPFFLTSCALLT